MDKNNIGLQSLGSTNKKLQLDCLRMKIKMKANIKLKIMQMIKDQMKKDAE